LITLGVLFSFVVTSCEKDEPSPPTIFTGYVIDENNQPVEGIEFLLIGDKKGLFIRTESDSKGYFYLESIIPDGVGLVEFQFTYGRSKYTDGLYERFCLVNGVYQKIIPWSFQRKN
jgi:hypothetical protein